MVEYSSRICFLRAAENRGCIMLHSGLNCEEIRAFKSVDVCIESNYLGSHRFMTLLGFLEFVACLSVAFKVAFGDLLATG